VWRHSRHHVSHCSYNPRNGNCDPRGPAADAAGLTPVRLRRAPDAERTHLVLCGQRWPDARDAQLYGSTIAAGSNVVCVCYRLICSAGDTACTSAQIASGATRFAYTYVTTSTATQMALTPSIYASMFSCNTTDCNTVSSCAGSSSPPPKPPPPAGSGSNSTTVPASVPASVANSRAPPGAALHFATVLLTALLAVAFF